jgi:hypothetical protein
LTVGLSRRFDPAQNAFAQIRCERDLEALHRRQRVIDASLSAEEVAFRHRDPGVGFPRACQVRAVWPDREPPRIEILRETGGT